MESHLIKNLSDFIAIVESLLVTPSVRYWFRGHGNLAWELKPSALRYTLRPAREKALPLWNEFRRKAYWRVPDAPDTGDSLKWMQVAQHYGVPTRLLDWTESAVFALYFACMEPGRDGAVFVLNPVELNRNAFRSKKAIGPKILDAASDAEVLETYLHLDGVQREDGDPTVAMHPVLNNERMVLQRGAFTLHGSKQFGLDQIQAPGLTCIPILGEPKEKLRQQLEANGIDKMTLFPEPEYVSEQLIQNARLPKLEWS